MSKLWLLQNFYPWLPAGESQWTLEKGIMRLLTKIPRPTLQEQREHTQNGTNRCSFQQYENQNLRQKMGRIHLASITTCYHQNKNGTLPDNNASSLDYFAGYFADRTYWLCVDRQLWLGLFRNGTATDRITTQQLDPVLISASNRYLPKRFCQKEFGMCEEFEAQDFHTLQGFSLTLASLGNVWFYDKFPFQ